MPVRAKEPIKSGIAQIVRPVKETNRYMAFNDPDFATYCELAGIQRSARQMSKFRNKKGAAYAVFCELKKQKPGSIKAV